MREIIVSSLKQQLEIAGVDTLHLSDKEAKLFAQFIEKQAAFFDAVCNKKSDQNPQLLLLGLLTKQHVEATHILESQLDAITAMHDVFANAVGSKQSDKLNADSVIELSLITKLWLMLQGNLDMDFSLANDHATQTAELLSKALRAHSQEIRTELIASFYHGKETVPSPQWSNKVLNWVKSITKAN
ncbi:hypothetical protein MACH09_38370 [Vibrio sp. MACH09]|uniref:hypothetical protein n=1 Tax=Vibrio sp. MACH09 TaxID=3025122 RepID=UPI00278EF7C2|nr:hypothetical protein [Vibrio sp. MACH09]GLO63329.1 hypothetical protein MACH09_38370 [Vibrio sp. MACH09]